MLAEIMEVSRQLLVLLYKSIALPGPCWQVICHQERGLSREAAAARLCCQPPLSRTLAALREAIAGPPQAQLPLRQLSTPQRLGTHNGTGLCVCVATLHTGHLRCLSNPQLASAQVVQPRAFTGESTSGAGCLLRCTCLRCVSHMHEELSRAAENLGLRSKVGQTLWLPFPSHCNGPKYTSVQHCSTDPGRTLQVPLGDAERHDKTPQCTG